MIRFQAKTSPTRLLLRSLWILLAGTAASFGALEYLPGETLAVVIGVIGMLLTLGAVIASLARTPRRVEVAGPQFRVVPYIGSPEVYDIREHRFAPVAQTHEDSALTTHKIKIESRAGETTTIDLPIRVSKYDELIALLTGVHTAPPPGQAPQMFQPEVFVTERRGPFTLAWSLVIGGFGGAVLGAVLVVITNQPPTVFLACLMPLAFGPVGLHSLKRAHMIPREIVVAPAWVRFDDTLIAYQQLQLLEVPPPGKTTDLQIIATLDTGQKLKFPLGYGDSSKVLPGHARLAEMLVPVTNAVNPVARYRHSRF